jgi:hypothetical protein
MGVYNGGGISFFSVPNEGNTLKPGAKRTTLESSECCPHEPKKRRSEVVHKDKMVIEIDKGVAECKISPLTVETVLEDGMEEEYTPSVLECRTFSQERPFYLAFQKKTHRRNVRYSCIYICSGSGRFCCHMLHGWRINTRLRTSPRVPTSFASIGQEEERKEKERVGIDMSGATKVEIGTRCGGRTNW